MALKRKGKQFADVEYRYVDDGPGKKQVLARDTGADRIVGHMSLDTHMHPKSSGKSFGGNNPGGFGLGVGLAYTTPEVRGQGIAGAMYNIASRELGYKPMHDNVRSPAGDRFARSVGGPFHPTDNYEKPVMQQWELLDGGEEMQDIQRPNWERGTPIDSTIAGALTPQKPKQRRKRKSDGVQDQLPGMDKY